MKKICKMHKAEHGHKTCAIHKAGEMSEPLGVPKAGKNMKAGHPSKEMLGTSSGMGASLRGEGSPTGMPNIARAKREARTSLAAQRAMPKPKLEKACAMHKAEFSKRACSLHKSEEHSVPETNEREGMHDDKDSSCPYCQEQNKDNRTDDCQMCADLDAQENADGTAGMDDHSDCPYCQEMDGQAGAEDDCPYCDNMAIEQANPENSEGIAADDANPDSADSPHDCPECQKMYGDAVEEQPGQTGQEPPKTQGHETAEEVLDMLDQEPGTGEPPAEEAKQIDNTEMPQGDAMEDGTAVTDNFGQAQANDVSDADQQFQDQTQGQSQDGSEDQPDMANVLQGGLDEHAQEQKKAQVVDMVAQTLQGFKANKEFLEQTKEQNPGLYNSTIQMLKAMISLCELLGLQPKMPEQAAPEQAPPAPPQAAPSGGAAEPPKT